MDNLHAKGNPDRNKISLSEDWEVKYWSSALGISAKELKEAVEKVGNSSRKVREYIAGKGN
jgi:hypothetical protein